MLIRSFDARRGGNVAYKALAHPLTGEAAARLYAGFGSRPVAVFDPEDIATELLALHPPAAGVAGVFVQDIEAVGQPRAGQTARPVTELATCGADTVLIAAFDAERIVRRVRQLVPAAMRVVSLDEMRLPAEMLSNPRRYLDGLNFATNFAFFREEAGLSTRLVTSNYWAGYGAGEVRLWLRLYGGDGVELATWEEPAPAGAGGISIDSAEVKARFGLAEFTGHLFVHVIGVAGHDVVKYVLDTYGHGSDASLSCTHDANAWPAERYAGIPAPAADERVILWVQNCHGRAIPAGDIALDPMGAERPVPLGFAIPGFATAAVDVAQVLPQLRWPAQIEMRAGGHVVRPRYEVVRHGRRRIAHANVERADLAADPRIPALGPLFGRGFLLPLPVLPRGRYRTLIQPTPMATTQATLPVRLDVFDPHGGAVAQHFLGCLARDHAVAVDLDDVLPQDALADGGHAELVYDFRDGGSADGWLHALVRAEDRGSGHMAESSFGAHIFNTAMTYRNEPQSYVGAPPGLSTRLALRLCVPPYRCFAMLIYPCSADWHPHSNTRLLLHDKAGRVIAETTVAIAQSGSATVFPDREFGADAIHAAGPQGYMLVRDTTCRLFGYHGLMDETGRFSLDHMFGF